MEIYIVGHWRRPTNCLTNNCSGSYLWHFLSKNQHCSRQMILFEIFKITAIIFFWSNNNFFKFYHQTTNVPDNFSLSCNIYTYSNICQQNIEIKMFKEIPSFVMHFESTLCRRSHVSFSKWSWPLRVSNQMPIDPSTTTQTCKRRKNHHEYTFSLEKLSTKNEKMKKMSLRCLFLF